MIQFANFLQLLACICDIFGDEQLADLIGLIANAVTFSIAGCMG